MSSLTIVKATSRYHPYFGLQYRSTFTENVYSRSVLARPACAPLLYSTRRAAQQKSEWDFGGVQLNQGQEEAYQMLVKKTSSVSYYFCLRSGGWGLE